MLTFAIVLILVFIAVDLFVRFIVDPLILKSAKKNKGLKTSISQLDPTFKLATETMYDGGKPHDPEIATQDISEEKLTEDELKS